MHWRRDFQLKRIVEKENGILDFVWSMMVFLEEEEVEADDGPVAGAPSNLNRELNSTRRPTMSSTTVCRN